MRGLHRTVPKRIGFDGANRVPQTQQTRHPNTSPNPSSKSRYPRFYLSQLPTWLPLPPAAFSNFTSYFGRNSYLSRARPLSCVSQPYVPRKLLEYCRPQFASNIPLKGRPPASSPLVATSLPTGFEPGKVRISFGNSRLKASCNGQHTRKVSKGRAEPVKNDRFHTDMPMQGALFGLQRTPPDQRRPPRHPGTIARALSRPGRHWGEGNRQLAQRLVQWNPAGKRRRKPQENHPVFPHRKSALLCSSKVSGYICARFKPFLRQNWPKL
uniref:Uncharacterized protein n=1 Tax=Dendroctonus ponderosae TaxID=77166 RepID=A0AAR5Q3V6_DENPD